jgi:hypothetical protein
VNGNISTALPRRQYQEANIIKPQMNKKNTPPQQISGKYPLRLTVRVRPSCDAGKSEIKF